MFAVRFYQFQKWLERWRLRFASNNLEREYEIYEASHRILSIRTTIVFTILIVFLFSQSDFEYGGDYWYITFSIRLFGPILALNLWFFFTYSKYYNLSPRIWDFCFGTVASVLAILLSFSFGYVYDIPFGDWSFPFLANTMLIIFFTGLLFICSSIYFFISSIILSISFIIFLSFLTNDSFIIMETILNLTGCVIVTIATSRGLEKLRRGVFQRNFELKKERQRSDRLLYDVIPKQAAQRLKNGESVSDSYTNLVVIFIDITNFSRFAATTPIETTLKTLKAAFSAIDDCAECLGLEKVKTIGDGYMVVSKLRPTECGSEHAVRAVLFCFETLITTNKVFVGNTEALSLRIGIHIGSAFGGVLGDKRPVYDYWGDTVNIAARLENQSEPGRVTISDAVKEHLSTNFAYRDRGELELKGIGWRRAWFVSPLVQRAGCYGPSVGHKKFCEC